MSRHADLPMYFAETIFLGMPLLSFSVTDESPRSDKPTPRARGRQAEKEQARPARTTPTLDLFGKSRHDSSLEVEKEMKKTEEKKSAEDRLGRRFTDRKSPTGRKSPGPGRGQSPGPGRGQSPGPGRGKSPAGRKSPVDVRGRKLPPGGSVDCG